MDRRTRNLINNVANAVIDTLEKNGLTFPFASLDEVVMALGGRITVDNEFDYFTEAQITKLEGNRNFEISINSNQPEARQNFSIAHELGHLFLHMGYLIDNDRWNRLPVGHSYNRKGIGTLEYQANEFAAAFLMPEQEYIKVLKENEIHKNYFDMEPVAEYFGVSTEAAKNRGRWLEVLEWR